MTIEEAIRILDPNTAREALAEIEYYGGFSGKRAKIEACDEACRIAVAALSTQQGSKGVDFDHFKNEPLTLDELREMDGEPVWIVEYPAWGHWELSEDAEDYLMNREPAFYGMKHDDPEGRYGLHKLGWLAYRSKPREDKL